MSKITNTSKSPKPEWLFGLNPNAIEQQEAQGQKELTESSQLPKMVRIGYKDCDAKDVYQKMGIEILSTNNDDKLFVDVRLPEGWKVIPTDHSMWSNLVDENESPRGSIFYKAAFYDRSAFMNISPRYTIDSEYIESERDETGSSMRFVKAVDNKQNKELWRSEKHGYSGGEKAYNEAKSYLLNQLPEYENVFAYWDK
jgi:hypothetical protein